MPVLSEPVPAWWQARGVLSRGAVQNQGVANVGQLKHLATQMHTEMDTLLPGGVGFDLGFLPVPPSPDEAWFQSQRKVLNLGQLKAVAKPIYDRLNAISPLWVESQLKANGLGGLGVDYFQDSSSGYFYPWDSSTPTGENYQPVNLGQLKIVFALKLRDNTDGDSLPDLWERAVLAAHPEVGLADILELTDAHNADGDALTAVEEYQHGTDPFAMDSDGDGLSDDFQMDLAGKWTFDEVTSVITDHSSYGIDGDLMSATRIADGISGSAVSLTSNQQVKITPQPGQLDVGGNGADFSVSFWIRLHATRQSGWNSIFQKGDTSNLRTFHISLRPDSLKLHARLTSSASVNEGVDTSVATLEPLQWAHVSYVHSDGQLQLYINGQLDSSAKVSPSIANDDPFYIGKSAWLRGVNADFDEIRIHRRALTAVEVNQMARVDSDGDGSGDWLESLSGSDPNDPRVGGVDDPGHDSDGDGLNNALDAVHDDREINWKKTPESRYAWVEIADLDSVEDDDGQHRVKAGDGEVGYPLALNRLGQVLFSRGLWSVTAYDWVGLPLSGSLAVTVLNKEYTFDKPVFQFRGINDAGDLVGLSKMGTALGVRAGMVWKMQENGGYGVPEYFVKQMSIESDEHGVLRVGGIANDGMVQCVASGYDFSLFDAAGDGHETSLVSDDAGGGGFGVDLYGAGPTLDAFRGIGWKDRLLAPSEFDDAGGHQLDLLLRDGDSLEVIDSEKFDGMNGYGEIPDPSSVGIGVTPDDSGSRVWIAAGDRVLLEKQDGGGGSDRWHHPSSMQRGAKRVNVRGEAINDTEIWRNGNYSSLREILKQSTGTTTIEDVKAIDLSSNGSILIQAKIDGVYKAGVLLPIEIIPDVDRDGKIDLSDRAQVTRDNPFRWWLNDDKDDGYIGGSGRAVPGQTDSNGQDDHINGMADLIDFFPLHLDLTTALALMPKGQYEYRLKHAAGALKFTSVLDIEPGGDPNVDGAASYWRSESRAKGNAGIAVKTILTNGVVLTDQELDAFALGRGVLLVEAVRVTDQPLVLEIWKEGRRVTYLELAIKMDGVEKMFRHVNLCDAVPHEDFWGQPVKSVISVPSRIDEPSNYPDRLTNNKAYLYVHGYNPKDSVSGNQHYQRGFHAEGFKRLYQLGSRAKFVAVTWDGATKPDYHQAVYHAFKTSASFGGSFGFLPMDTQITVAAHSLGNVVVSNAIAHEKFRPAHYFMINAATPIEAYNSEQSFGVSGREMRPDMTERQWDEFDRLFHSASWYKNFPDTDHRHQLTWKGYFKKVREVTNVYNFSHYTMKIEE